MRQPLASERTRLQEELNVRRQRPGMVDVGFQVQELDARVGGGLLAGALAFRIFLFMVPFVYLVFTLLGAASAAIIQDPAQLAGSSWHRRGSTPPCGPATRIGSQNVSPAGRRERTPLWQITEDHRARHRCSKINL